MTQEEYNYFAENLKVMRHRQRIALILLGLILIAVGWRVIDASYMNRRIAANAVLSQQNFRDNAELKAKQDIADQTYIKYINEVVSQMWNKLQEDNPDLDVPQPLPLRPPGMPNVTKADLERPVKPRRTPSVTPTPIIVTQPGPTRWRTRYRKAPSFWDKLFKPQPTPRRRR